jgi:hypothetical protein
MKTVMGAHRTPVYILFVLALSIAIAACGGGGSGSSTDSGGIGTGTGPGTGTATIQGSVPGTVFVAVNNDTNLEVGRATATGTPKTFSMVVPTGTTYRFYVMENEGTGNSRVYPMYMGTNNVFELDNTANGRIISFGMINPDMGTGKAIPANIPTLMMGWGANATVPPSLAGTAFSMDNVKGTTWGYNTMMTSGAMGWEHGTLSFDNNGLGHMSGIVRNGAPLFDRDHIPYSMSLSGMLLNPGDNTFQCVVSKDMTVMVGTFTDNTGGPAMMIGQKRGGLFHTDGSDMTGTWRFQRLTAGSDNTSSGWAYGTMQFIFGSAGFSSMTTNAGVVGGGSFAFSMDANGIMSKTGDASFYGVMSGDKTMIVATDTNGGHPELWVMMKDTGGAYSTADMMGDWVMHSVSSGNSGSRGWTYGHSVVDASGDDTFSEMMGSAGPFSTTQMTFQMNGGVMTMGGTGGGMISGGTGGGMMGGGMMGGGLVTPTFHGTMNGAKNLMVSNYSDGSGGYPFTIQVK